MINDLKKGNEELNPITIETDAPNTRENTIENLKASIGGENFEYTSMYPEFANTADEEGFSEIATRLRAIASAEKNHEERYKKALEELENGTVFKKDTNVNWVCRKCGYLQNGKDAPEECPSCGHPRAYFEIG